MKEERPKMTKKRKSGNNVEEECPREKTFEVERWRIKNNRCSGCFLTTDEVCLMSQLV